MNQQIYNIIAAVAMVQSKLTEMLWRVSMQKRMPANLNECSGLKFHHNHLGD